MGKVSKMADKELLALFVQDSTELLRNLEQDILRLEDSSDDTDLLGDIFRYTHTLKGNAGIVGQGLISDFAHEMEDLLDKLRKREISVSTQMVSTLLSSVDLLESMVRACTGGAFPEQQAEACDRLSQAIQRLAQGEEQPISAEAPASSPEKARERPAEPRGGEGNILQISIAFGAGALQSGFDPTVLIEELSYLGRLESVEVDLSRLPPFKELEPGQVYLSWSLRLNCPSGAQPVRDLLSFIPPEHAVDVKVLSALTEEPSTVPSHASSPEPAVSPPAQVLPTNPIQAVAGPSVRGEPPGSSELGPVAAGAAPGPAPTGIPSSPPADGPAPASAWSSPPALESIRVPVSVLDRLMELAGEMVLTRNQLIQSVATGDEALVERACQRVDALTGDLQDAVMATRMQPIRVVFDKFRRTVRDLATRQGKQIRLLADDRGVELDTTVIEAISAPMAHLVRNAVDHGIEFPEKRLEAGKPAVGTIWLRARHEAGQVIVEVKDDGTGLDADKIRAHAVGLGLLKPSRSASLSSAEIHSLLFKPGFSTASQVTDLSGRGVGLDVVHTNLAAIGASIRIDSSPGAGCVFQVTLPLTLAIMSAILVQVEGERFAIPQANIKELIRVRAQDLGTQVIRVGGVDVTWVRGELVSLVRLSDLLGIRSPTFVHPRSGERLPNKRRNIADRRGPDATAPRTDPDRRRMGDRRHSRASALNMVVLATGDCTFALLVDSLLDSVEIVVKPFGRHLRDCQVYAGATVLGDGHVALILDVMGMSRMAFVAEKTATAAAHELGMKSEVPQEEDKLPVVLMAGAKGEVFCLPLHQVRRVLKVDGSDIRTVGRRRVLQRGREVIPMFTVDQVADTVPLPPEQQRFALVFRFGERDMALLCSQVMDIVELEDDLDRFTYRQPGISGSLYYGETQVLVVDPKELVLGVFPHWGDDLEDAGDSRDRPSVLVVDDSAFFLDHIAAMMEEAGYQVSRAADGSQALGLLDSAASPFDLILTDIEMPVMDGFDFVTRLRRDPRFQDIPVIAITTLTGRENLLRARDAGIDAFSVKLDREHVLERCRYYLEHGRETPTEPRELQ